MTKLKLDEDLSHRLKTSLTTLPYDVATAADENLLSQPDTAVGAAAAAEGRMLLTLDVEFADLRKHPPGTHPGIVVFRPRSFGPIAVNQFVEDFAREVDLNGLAGCVVIAEPNRIRVRRPPTQAHESAEDLS